MRLPVLPASLLCSLALAAPAHATVGASDLDALVDRSLDGLFTLRLPSGGYDDPLAGPRFNYGAIGLAWLTGERAPAGPEGDARRAAAATTFRTGARTARPGAFQIWLEALALTAPSGAWLDAETRAALSAHSPRSRTRRSARARSHATTGRSVTTTSSSSTRSPRCSSPAPG